MNAPASISVPSATKTFRNNGTEPSIFYLAFSFSLIVGAGITAAVYLLSAPKSSEAKVPARAVVISESSLKVATDPGEVFLLEVQAMEARYPELNRESPKFSKDLHAEVMEKMKAFKEQGLSPSRALLRSADFVMGKYKANQILKANRAAKAKKQAESLDDVATGKPST